MGLKELIAISVGGMIGGGIFSVVGIAVRMSGHGTPVAFALGGILAAVAGYSYVRLALCYQSDGASFTYLERAFPTRPMIGGVVGWVVVLGYIGTLGLYAFTFGAYGAELMGSSDDPGVRRMLSLAIIGLFGMINLLSSKSSGAAEDVIVYVKILLLGLLAVAGAGTVKAELLTPVFDKGLGSVFLAGATIFVAYEGFQLVTNAVMETKNPDRNIPRSIFGSIAIVIMIYVGLSVVAIGSLPEADLIAAEEYALAVAAEPALGHAGRILVAVAALLATSSAINATMFGASRLVAEMATTTDMPTAFSFRNRTDVPWLAVVVIMALAMCLTFLGSLEFIASFSSLTFMLVSFAVGIANLVLRKKTGARVPIVVLGNALLLVTIITLVFNLIRVSPGSLAVIGGIYAFAVVADRLARKEGAVA